MIYQRSDGMNSMVKEFGCYFMSLLCAVSRETLEAFDVARIEGIYRDFVKAGVMTEKCFVLRPDAVFRAFGLSHRYTGQHASVDAEVPEEGIEILYFHYNGELSRHRDWFHFTLGNGKGQTSYDPWPKSVTANFGTLLSKRLFLP